MAYNNPIGNGAVAALATQLRKLPALALLSLNDCEIDDEGVASLFADLGKDDFKSLEQIWIQFNHVTDTGVAKLVAAIQGGGLPKICEDNIQYIFPGNSAVSEAAVKAAQDALAKRSQ